MFMQYRKKSLPIKRIPNKSCSHFKYTVKPESRDKNFRPKLHSTQFKSSKYRTWAIQIFY